MGGTLGFVGGDSSDPSFSMLVEGLDAREGSMIVCLFCYSGKRRFSNTSNTVVVCPVCMSYL